MHLSGGASLLIVNPTFAEDKIIDKDHLFPPEVKDVLISSSGSNNSIKLDSYDGLKVYRTNPFYGVKVDRQDLNKNEFVIKAKDTDDQWFTGNNNLIGFYTGISYIQGAPDHPYLSATNNSLILSFGKYTFNKYNGITGVSVFKGKNLQNNYVELNNVDLTGKLIGCNGTNIIGEVTDNELIINSGHYTQVDKYIADTGIYGVSIGFKANLEADSQVSYNTLTINDGTFDVKDISAIKLNTTTKPQKIENNVLTINGGVFKAGTHIYGIMGKLGEKAEKNGVIINGGVFKGATIYAVGDAPQENSLNFIEINANDSLDLSKVIFRGTSVLKPASTLYINNAHNLHIKSIQYFNKLVLKDIVWQTNTPAISTADADFKEIEIDRDSGFVLLGQQKIANGDRMTLVQTPYPPGKDPFENLNLGTGDTETVYTQANVARDLSGKILKNGNKLDFEITDVKLAEQTQLINENRAVTAAFLNASSDMALNALNMPQTLHGITTFISTEGYASSYDVNNDLKVNGFHQAIGFHGRTELNQQDDLRLAFYFEQGNGNYRTFNHQHNEFFRGDGEVEYLGGALAARYTLKNGFYFDGSLRLGKLETQMDNAVRSSQGKLLGYETRSDYFGAHLGLGKNLLKTDQYELDLYSRFYFTKINDDKLSLGGDDFYFDDVTSQRFKIGSQIRSPMFGFYADIAYEYEFDGDANMTVADFSAPCESLQGGTFLGSLGFNHNFANTPLWLDLKLSGFSGEHNGIGGKILLSYEI